MKKIFTTALLAIASLTTHAQRDARVQLQLGNWGSSRSASGFFFSEHLLTSRV